MVRSLLLALGSFLAVVTTVSAEEQRCVFPPRNQVSAEVRAKVTRSAGRFDYFYLLENRPSAQQTLIWFAVEALSPSGTQPTQISPAEWDAAGAITNSSFYVWDMLRGSRGLTAGAAATGFGFVQADLPAIVTFLAWGDVEPPSFPEGAAPECENTDIIENSFKGKTVGPKPPPKDFVAIEFLNYLITLVHDSGQLGWITRDGAKTSVLAKLTNAKRKLEAGDTKVTKNMLKAFLNEVEATSFQEFECPGNKPLTSEAYALLFFNGRFLWERL
jgi:hypothetical protein